MRRYIPAAVAALALAMPGLADAAAKDRVQGTGEFGPQSNRFELEAQSGPNGEDVQGHVFVFDNRAKASYKADIVCMRTVGNRAVLLGNLTDLRNPGLAAFEGGGVRIDVEDNSPPGPSGPPDRFGNILFTQSQFGTFNNQCPLPFSTEIPFVGTAPLTKGDIKVEDTP